MKGEFETILVSKEKNITTITFNRPKKKNAMNPKFHEEMLKVISELEEDEETRVLILTGAGDSFCAGEDLKEFFYEGYQEGPMARRKRSKFAQGWAEKLRLFPRPTIAMVNGWCFGGGFRVMCECDFAIASTKAVFGLSEVNFGIFPAGGTTKITLELLSHRDALYYILTGETMTAEHADKLRLVNKAVPPEELRSETMKLAQKLCKLNPITLMIAKDVFWRDKYMHFREAIAWETAKHSEMDYLQGGEWVKKGIPQFMEKQYRPGFGPYKRGDK
jgi:trans-feruloyl-CoA hydratase/vanillin synthase